MIDSIDELQVMLAHQRYLLDRDSITVIYLALRLEKALLLEGPPGAGKTEVAKVLAQALELPLVRLQCYEGIDESRALYQWNEPLQRMYLEFLKVESAGTEREWCKLKHDLYSTDFLIAGPILRALQSDRKAVLLIDEVDKVGPSFEAFLLEVLSDFQVSIPQLGTLTPQHRPVVVLTSNAQRKLTDALRGRCFLLWMDYPTAEREAKIIAARAAGSQQLLSVQVARFTNALRHLGMGKPPAIRESLDWIRALATLGAEELSPEVVSLTLPVLLKTRADIERAAGNVPLLLQRACCSEHKPTGEPQVTNPQAVQ